ncbi:Putative XAP5 domain-containing protein [Penicillium brasilianum]|uniref:Putative XAP5 domain-containing protein n=1 Tax=Penicillium brasilianum TaxID=104259 RepID=A0A0F7TRK8_PENBI|nr:Putative XAP5 domain-containing protein [Penicillium brasilianum]
MDFHLRCNSLKCRTQLKEKAVVTTCSHIFCLGCADGLGLFLPTAEDRRCPACQTVLSNPDDAVSTILNPTEDYKTSVLSGLDPNTIMECAGRALGFWAYQSTQEIFYQEYLGKSLTEKYSSLSTQMDKVIHNANSEISTLHSKVSDLQTAQEQLEKKNQELVDLYREKSKKLAQMTNLYNLLKARAMKSRMETAASENASQTLNNLSSRTGPTMPPAQPGPAHPRMSMPNIQKARTPKTPSFDFSPEGVEQLHRYQRSGTGSSRMSRPQMGGNPTMPPPVGHAVFNIRTAQTSATSQQHRTRLPHPNRPPTVMSRLPPADEILARFGKQ